MIRCWLALILAVAGCEGPKSDASTSTGADTGGAEIPAEPPLLDGLFLLGMTVAPVAGLVQPLQIEVSMTRAEDGTRTIESIVLRATDGDEAVSVDLSTVTDIVVNDDDTFTVDWSLFVLSPEFSPTGNPVEIEAVMEATIQDDTSFCGDVTGSVVSFDLDLAGSTFGARPWEDRILGVTSSCDGASLEDLPRIETCPNISSGANTGFPSGGQSRKFEVAIPDDYDAAGSYPLVFGFHGLSGNGIGFMDDTDLREQASLHDSIIVAPDAMESGTAVFDPIGDPEYNLDIVLFDDLLTCMSEQYSVDSARVHVTGMSLGGLFTGTLITTRSDVIASAAPFSGGIWRDKVDGSVAIPSLVTWGGPDDISQGQDFDGLGQDMIDLLTEDGHAVVSCNHSLGHEFESEFWTWAFRFFADHPQGAPTPYSDTLPSVFPDYCEIVSTGN